MRAHGSALAPEENSTHKEPETEEDDDNTAWQEMLAIKNTFLRRVRMLQGFQSVIQSTTEAHGGINPRRFDASALATWGEPINSTCFLMIIFSFGTLMYSNSQQQLLYQL